MKRIFIAVICTALVASGIYVFSHERNVQKENEEKDSKATVSDPGDDVKYIYADYNFDGHEDRGELLDCGATGNCQYAIELYDPELKVFPPPAVGYLTQSVRERSDDERFVVTNPSVNPEEKIICSYSNSSVAEFSYHIYTYSKGYFYPVKEIRADWDPKMDKLVKKTATISDGVLQKESTSYLSPESESSMPNCTLK